MRGRRLAWICVGVVIGALLVPSGVAVAEKIKDVFITNDAAHPVPAVAGGSPLVLSLHDFCTEDGDSFTVPEGKRLVIEDVAGSVTAPTGERRRTLLLIDDPTTPEVPFAWVLPQTLQENQSTSDIYLSHESLKTYAESGWKVEARIGCPLAPSGGGMGLTISGYLIDA